MTMTAAEYNSHSMLSSGTKRSASHLSSPDKNDIISELLDDQPQYTLLPFYGEHRRAVSSVAFCPTLPSYSHPHHFVDRATGTPGANHTSSNLSSTICASASADGTVKLWDLRYHLANLDLAAVNGHGDSSSSTDEGQSALQSSEMEGTDSISNNNNNHMRSSPTGLGQDDSISDNNNAQTSSSSKNIPIAPIITLQGHSRGINDVAWNPRTGEVIATASDDKTLRLWDVTRGCGSGSGAGGGIGGIDHMYDGSHAIGSTTIGGGSGDAAVSGSGVIDGGGGDGSNNNTGSVLAGNPSTGMNNSNNNASSSPDASLVEFKGHSNFCFSVKFSPNGNLLVSGSFDETVKVWDVRTGECISTLPAHSDPVTGVDFNRDGTCIVSSSHDGLIRIWDVATGECLKTIYAEGNPPVTFVRYSPNGKFVLSGMLDGKLRLWSVLGKFATGGLSLDFGLGGGGETGGSGGAGLAGSKNGSNDGNNLGGLSLLGDSSTTIHSKSGGQCTKTYSGHANTKYCIFSAFAVGSPNPKRHSIVTGSEDGKIYVYNLQSRAIRQVLDGGHEAGEAVLAVAAHDSKELIASGGMSNDRTVRFWAPSSVSGLKDDMAIND